MNLPPLPEFPSQGTADEKNEWFRLADLHARQGHLDAMAADLEARNRAIAASESHAKAQADTATAMIDLAVATRESAESFLVSPQPHEDELLSRERQSAALEKLATSIGTAGGLGVSTGVPVPVMIELIQAFALLLSAKTS